MCQMFVFSFVLTHHASSHSAVLFVLVVDLVHVDDPVPGTDRQQLAVGGKLRDLKLKNKKNDFHSLCKA